MNMLEFRQYEKDYIEFGTSAIPGPGEIPDAVKRWIGLQLPCRFDHGLRFHPELKFSGPDVLEWDMELPSWKALVRVQKYRGRKRFIIHYFNTRDQLVMTESVNEKGQQKSASLRDGAE